MSLYHSQQDGGVCGVWRCGGRQVVGHVIIMVPVLCYVHAIFYFKEKGLVLTNAGNPQGEAGMS